MSWTERDRARRKAQQAATRLQRAIHELEIAERRANASGLALPIGRAIRIIWRLRHMAVVHRSNLRRRET